MAVPDDGFKVNVGGHLIEDPGSGLTKVFEHGATSAEMPVWDHEKQARGSARDRYSGSKAELKKVIKALIDTPARGPGTGARPSWPITRRCSQGTQSTWTGPFGTSGTGPPYRPCHRRPTRPCGGRWAVAEAVGVTLPVEDGRRARGVPPARHDRRLDQLDPHRQRHRRVLRPPPALTAMGLATPAS
jgi:hypothetical protein